MLGDQWRDLGRGDLGLAVHQCRVAGELGAEGLLVAADRLEGFVQVDGVLLPQRFLTADVEAHQVAVAGAEAEPAPHLHEGVGLLGGTAVVRDREALHREAAGELRATDQDLPHVRCPVEVQLGLFVVAFGGTVDDDHGFAARVDQLPGPGYVRLQIVVRRGGRQTVVGVALEVGGQQGGEACVAFLARVSRPVPHRVDAQGEGSVFPLLYGLVDEHRVVAERLFGHAVLHPVQLQRAGEDEGVQRLLQAVAGAVVDAAYVRLLGGALGIQIVEVLYAHVTGRAGQRDQEVAGEDVLLVARIHEDVGEGCCRVADVLGARKQIEELCDLAVDGLSDDLAVLPLLGIRRVHGRLVRLVVDDQRRDLGEDRTDLLQVLDQLGQDRRVLLHHHHARGRVMEVVGDVQGPGAVLLVEFEGPDAGFQALVVVVPRREALDVEGTPRRRVGRRG